MINLKPLQSYSEYDKINGFFALNTNSAERGSFVTIIGSGWVNNYQDMYRFINLTSEPNVVSNYRVLTAQVRLAASGEGKGTVLGIIDKNVRSVDYLGRDLAYDDVRKTEANAVLSGEAIPIVKRGLFLVSGISAVSTSGGNLYQTGVVNVGSGIAVDLNGAGGWRSFNPAVETSVKALGQVLGAPDRNGFALVWIDC